MINQKLSEIDAYVEQNIIDEESKQAVKLAKQAISLILDPTKEADRAKYLAKLEEYVVKVEDADLELYDMLEGVRDTIRQLVSSSSTTGFADLGEVFKFVKSICKSPTDIIRGYNKHTYDWFKSKGAKFFKIETKDEKSDQIEHKYYTILDGSVFEVSTTMDIKKNRLLKIMTMRYNAPNINDYDSRYTKAALEYLYCEVSESDDISTYTEARWCIFDIMTEKLYLNMPNKEIIQVSRDGICALERVDMDEFHLRESRRMNPKMKFVHGMQQPDIVAALNVLKDNVLEFATCGWNNMVYLIARQFALFLNENVSVIPHLEMSGTAGSSKSFYAKVLSHLVYGGEKAFVTASSTAASFNRSLEWDPMLVIDNVEKNNMTEAMYDILLFYATGGNRDKVGSTMTEPIKGALTLTTIDTVVEKKEHLRRTVQIKFDAGKKSEKWVSDTHVIREIRTHSNEIFSAMVYILQQFVLDKINTPEYRAKVKQYSRYFSVSGSEGLADFNVLVSYMIEGLAYYGIELQDGVAIDDFMKELVSEQSLTTMEAADTNRYFDLLSTIVEYNLPSNQIKGAVENMNKAYEVKHVIIDGIAVGIEGTAAQLYNAASKKAKEYTDGFRLPTMSAKSLGERFAEVIKSDKGVLRGNIHIEKEHNGKVNIYKIYRKIAVTDHSA